MLLPETEIPQIIEKVKAAFPNFSNWQYNNEVNPEYLGFSVWGEYIFDPEELMSQCFFITFDTYKEEWRGYLTIGQHSYFWSSADVGDAHLLGVGRHHSIDEAIKSLKAEMVKLFDSFSAI